MQKRHFEQMAAIVRAIRAGNWTNDLPTLPSTRTMPEPYFEDKQGNDATDDLRAVWVAEAFIELAKDFPRFDEQRFLKACGLL